MNKLSDLPNIGIELERQLNQVGIKTFNQLKEIGSKETWLKIKKIDESACIHRLYTIEGATENIKKTNLSIEKKEELKAFYNMSKIKVRNSRF